MGRSAARLFLYPIALYFFVTAKVQRQASAQYLQKLGRKEPSWGTVVKHFHCFASTILDRVYLLTNRFQLFDIRIHNSDVLLDRVEEGKGCILLGAHVGSFEILRSLAADRDLPLKILMYHDHNQGITEVLFSLNPEIRDSVIPLGSAFSLVEVHEHLSEGGLVGMLGDRVAESDKVVRCSFLGQEADFPAGPVLLASATGAPVILFVGLYRGGKRYDIHFELLEEKVELDRESRESDAQLFCGRYAQRLEHYVRCAPYNWFNFYRFWDDE